MRDKIVRMVLRASEEDFDAGKTRVPDAIDVQIRAHGLDTASSRCDVSIYVPDNSQDQLLAWEDCRVEVSVVRLVHRSLAQDLGGHTRNCARSIWRCTLGNCCT